MDQTETLFDVRGMNCGSCVRRITAALETLDGVGEVRVSRPDGTVSVRHDAARLSAGQLAAAIVAEGFPAAAVVP